MAKRGRRPLENPLWRAWASRVGTQVARYGICHVYFRDSKIIVRSPGTQYSKSVPEGAVFMRTFTKPFSNSHFHTAIRTFEQAPEAGRVVPGPPRPAQRVQRDMAQRVQHAICVYQRPVEVYLLRDPLAVTVRCNQRRAPKALPACAEYLGAYGQPFCSRDFWDDIDAHLATVRAGGA